MNYLRVFLPQGNRGIPTGLFNKFTNIYFIKSITIPDMPYCTECGQELRKEHKFCTRCGASVESGDMRFRPSPRKGRLGEWLSSVRTLQKNRFSKKHVIAGSIVLLVVLAVVVYSVGVPLAKGAGGTIPKTPVMTPVPTLQNPPETPEWTITPEPATESPESETDSAEPETLPATPTPELTRMITFPKDADDSPYKEVYSNINAYEFGETQEFTTTLTNPPLDIHFSVEPRIITREKLANIGTSAEHKVTATYTDPRAWFEVKVINVNGGSVIERQGFNRDFSITTDQEFTVRMPGKYRIEMSGNAVTASVRIYSGTA